MNNCFIVNINTIEKAIKFVNICSKFEEEIDARSSKYIVNAKSIMGIFSINLLKPITIYIDTDDEKRLADFCDAIYEFIGDSV